MWDLPHSSNWCLPSWFICIVFFQNILHESPLIIDKLCIPQESLLQTIKYVSLCRWFDYTPSQCCPKSKWSIICDRSTSTSSSVFEQFFSINNPTSLFDFLGKQSLILSNAPIILPGRSSLVYVWGKVNYILLLPKPSFQTFSQYVSSDFIFCSRVSVLMFLFIFLPVIPNFSFKSLVTNVLKLQWSNVANIHTAFLVPIWPSVTVKTQILIDLHGILVNVHKRTI